MPCSWKMIQCNTTIDLKINLGHSDLYFMVHWFFIFCSERHFSFIGNARFRRAALSCDSSYSIRLTRLCNIVKLGFAGVYIISSFCAFLMWANEVLCWMWFFFQPFDFIKSILNKKVFIVYTIYNIVERLGTNVHFLHTHAPNAFFFFLLLLLLQNLLWQVWNAKPIFMDRQTYFVEYIANY